MTSLLPISTHSPLLFTYEEAARKLRISKGTLRTLVESGDVSVVRIGERSVRFAEVELHRLVASKTQLAESA